MYLVHGGAPIRVFTPSVFKVLCRKKLCDVIDDVGRNQVNIDEVTEEGAKKVQKEVYICIGISIDQTPLG